jgi:hypothetical protein
VLIFALTTSFLAGIENSGAIEEDFAAQAQVELSAGIPFVSDDDLESALDDAGVPPETADAITEEYETARLDGLRASLSVLAGIALIALFFTRRIPTTQPSTAPSRHAAEDSVRTDA